METDFEDIRGEDFETIHSWNSATIFGYLGQHLEYIKRDTEDDDQPRLAAIKEVDDMLRETDRSAYIMLATSMLDLALVEPSNDKYYQYSVFTIFRYTVMGFVFKTLKRLRKLTEKILPVFAERMKSLESHIKAEDIQNWKDLAVQMPPLDEGQNDIQYVVDEWRLLKELLVKVVPALCTKDQAEEKASSELAKFRKIWEDVVQLDMLVRLHNQ